MKLTNEKGNFQTWNTEHNGEDIIIRVNKKADIVIIRNNSGEQELIRREPYSLQAFRMIRDYYEGNLYSNYDKYSSANFLNKQATMLIEGWSSCDIEMIDPETAYMSPGESLPIYRPKNRNTSQMGYNKNMPLPERTRWIFEPYNKGFLLHLHSKMDVDAFMGAISSPALSIYKPKKGKSA